MSHLRPKRITAWIKFGRFRPGTPDRRAPAAGARPALARWLTGLALYLPLLAGAADAGSDALYPLLRGEFALQQGRSAEASAAYVEAARQSHDPAVAERATRIALLAGDDAAAAEALARWRTLAPGAGDQAQLAALLAVRAGDATQAEQALVAMLQTPDGWRSALRVLATDSHSLIAATLLRALIDAPGFPTEVEPMMAFGELGHRLGLDGVERTLAERASERHPDAPRVWLWRAQIERRHDEREIARQSIERALSLPGLDPPMRLNAASQLDALGDPQAAAAALAGGEQDDQTLLARAAYLARAENPAALAALYDEIAAPGAAQLTPERRYLLGQLAELREQREAALDWYRSLTEGRHHDQAQLRIAVLQEQGGDLPAALATLHALQTSDSEDGELLVDSYLLESELQRRQQHEQLALQALQRGLAVFEDEPELLYAAALAAERVGDVDAAVSGLRKLVALDPGNADALNALGYTLADRTGKYQEALDLIQRAATLKPDNAAILDSLGWVLHKLGRSNEALAPLQRSFEMARDAEVAAHLGEVLWQLGRHDDARRVWQQGGELDGHNRALQATLERFKP